MEVKIKSNEGMIDATIEMVDGVMVVSPKKVKFEPEDGDIVSIFDGQHVFINKDYRGYDTGYAYLGWNFDSGEEFKEGVWNYSRYATEEEKQKLFKAIADNGLVWDAEKKQLVKLKWKPKDGEVFHFPIFSDVLGEFDTDYQKNDNTIIPSVERGWCFKTEEECQEFCDRLNKAINQVKP